MCTSSAPLLCSTFYDPLDCSPPSSFVQEISQTRVLEWVTISSSRGSSQPRARIHISCISYIDRKIDFFFFLTTELPGKTQKRYRASQSVWRTYLGRWYRNSLSKDETVYQRMKQCRNLSLALSCISYPQSSKCIL